MNPLAQMMGGTAIGGINPQMLQAAQSVKRMMGALRAAQNPQTAIMQATQQNPQLGAVMQMCQGRNPQDVFADECKKHGLDPDKTMKQIQSIMGS